MDSHYLRICRRFGWVLYFVWKDKMPLWFVGGGGTLLVLQFFIVGFLRVTKSCCEKENIYLWLGMKGKDIPRRFVAFCVLFIYLFAFVFLFASKYSFFFFGDVEDYNFLFFNFLMSKWLLEGSCNTMESGYNGR